MLTQQHYLNFLPSNVPSLLRCASKLILFFGSASSTYSSVKILLSRSSHTRTACRLPTARFVRPMESRQRLVGKIGPLLLAFCSCKIAGTDTAVVVQNNINNCSDSLYLKQRHTIARWETVTKRREPRSSRSSALNATLSNREEHTSRAQICMDSLDASRDKPMVTPTPLPTRSLESRGEMIPSLNTSKTQRSTSRCVYIFLD
jgi:hypothetical protein